MTNLGSQQKMAGPFIILHQSLHLSCTFQLHPAGLTLLLKPLLFHAGVQKPKASPRNNCMFIGLMLLQHVSLRSQAGKDIGT